MVSDSAHDCANCKAPTCTSCGSLIGNRDRHAAKCREKLQELIPGECPESKLDRDTKGRVRNLPCALSGDHDWHEISFEGYRHRWMARELITV